MKIFNLTGSNLTFSIGAARVQVKNLESSSSIVATPELVRNNILPLIEAFNGGIILVPNTSDMLVFDMPGCRVPDECVADDKTANQKLNQAIAQYKKANAKSEPKKDNKPEPKPEVKPEVKEESNKPENEAPANTEPKAENKENQIPQGGIEVKVIPGKDSQNKRK